MLKLEHAFAEPLRGRGGERTLHYILEQSWGTREEESAPAELHVSESQKLSASGKAGCRTRGLGDTRIPSRTKEAGRAQQPAQVLLVTRDA